MQLDSRRHVGNRSDNVRDGGLLDTSVPVEHGAKAIFSCRAGSVGLPSLRIATIRLSCRSIPFEPVVSEDEPWGHS